MTKPNVRLIEHEEYIKDFCLWFSHQGPQVQHFIINIADYLYGYKPNNEIWRARFHLALTAEMKHPNANRRIMAKIQYLEGLRQARKKKLVLPFGRGLQAQLDPDSFRFNNKSLCDIELTAKDVAKIFDISLDTFYSRIKSKIYCETKLGRHAANRRVIGYKIENILDLSISEEP